MTALLLFLITICSFLFYGVVGADKTWLLAPMFFFSYALVTAALLKRAWSMGHRAEREFFQTSYCKFPAATALWISFLVYGLIMIPQAVVPFESKLVMLFIGGVLGAYLVWGVELTTFKDNRVLLGFLIFIVMGLALYGLIVHFRCPMKILWTDRYADYEGRLASTYICPNHFAHLMQMLMPFCVVLLFVPQSGLFLRLLGGYSFLVFLPPLFLTESRAGWLGTIVAVGVVICLMAFRRSKKLFLLLAILIPLCSTLLLFAGWRFSETFQRRAKPVVEFLKHQGEEGVGSESKDFRPQTWMDTIDMVKEAPVIGFGPGNYRYTFPEHRKRFKANQIVTGHPHNEYLELMADYGLIGFVLFALAWLYGLIRILIASLKAEETRHAFIGFAFLGTAAGTMVHSFFDFEMHVYPNALVFAFLAAIAVGPLFYAKRARGTRHEVRGSRDRGEAALEDGGSKPLSAHAGESSRERSQGMQTSISHRDRRANGDEGAESRARSPKDGSQGADNSRKPEVRRQKPSLFLNWGLAVGYLIMTIFCFQTMSSAFIRALADKAAPSPRQAPDTMLHAKRFYETATGIDPQNWRAYKGMSNLLFNQRYYSLDMTEKVHLAEEECSWYEKAYAHNPKDPELISAYGKCLLFLAKARNMEHGAGRMENKELSRRDSGASGMEKLNSPSSVRSAVSARDHSFPSPEEHIERGLNLLREACRYRPFNDVCWWSLGVELRKLGQYEEALVVFQQARSLRNTPTTRTNIKWIEKQLKLREGAVSQQEDISRRDSVDNGAEKPPVTEWHIPATNDADADPDLMKLFEVMGQ